MSKPFRRFARTIALLCVALALILPQFADSLTTGSSSVPIVQADDDQSTTDTPSSEPTISDTDGDGIPDDQDTCPSDPTDTCNLPPDADGDGIPDDQDECPDDPSNSCNIPSDTDGDGIPDDQDTCPSDPTDTCNLPPDADGDGIPDDQDTCPDDPANSCAVETPTATETSTATETPTVLGSPEVPVEAASAAIPPAPWQLSRLPFNGTYTISQGPQAAACASLGLSHIQGGYGSNERAIDFPMSARTAIYAAGDGVVQFEGWEGSGNLRQILIRIQHPGGLVTWYAHLSQTVIDTGWTVTAGQLIGYSGDTGASGAFHLHFAATQGASYTSPSVDIRGMPGIVWNSRIVWNDGGFISNCAALIGQTDGTATGAPGQPAPTATRVPPTATKAPPTATKVPPTATRVPPTSTAVPPSKTPTRVPTTIPGAFPIGSSVRTTNKVNMRSGAGTGFGVQSVIASGTQCSVLGGPTAANGYKWYRLDCGSSRIGWIAGSYLKAGSSVQPTSTPAPAKTATKTLTTSPGGIQIGGAVRTTVKVNMRSGAGTSYGVQSVIASGTQCTVLGGPSAANGYQWYRLDCGSSRTGWVAGNYLKKV